MLFLNTIAPAIIAIITATAITTKISLFFFLAGALLFFGILQQAVWKVSPYRTFLDIHYRTDWDDFRLLCFAARRYSPVDQCLL